MVVLKDHRHLAARLVETEEVNARHPDRGIRGIRDRHPDRRLILHLAVPDVFGTRCRDRDRHPQLGRASLRRLEYHEGRETIDGEYPFTLTSGRTLYQFNAGTMTARTDNQQLRPADTLDMTRTDAQRLGVTTGDRVRVVSRHGRTVMPVRIDDSVLPGTLFATFHTPAAFLNRVTSSVRDPVGTPEYKVTAVRLEKFGA